MLPKCLPMFWCQLSIPDPRAADVLRNFYHCDLAISGVTLENIKVPPGGTLKNKLSGTSDTSFPPHLRVHWLHAKKCTNNYKTIH